MRDPLSQSAGGEVLPHLGNHEHSARADKGKVNWDDFDLENLTGALRKRPGDADAEKTIWAFEEALRVARIDEELLGYQLAAITCLLARLDGCSPRDVLDAWFRRSVSDEEWREGVLPLFD
jgi:hypothetical protein